MKSDPTAPADQLNLLRQQLILAQVRIMELEDERDSLTPRLQELEELLKQAQTLADRKMDETAHLEKVLVETQTQGETLRQLQSESKDELVSARQALTLAEASITRLNDSTVQLEQKLQQQGSELSTLKSSRSWRWTAWLRALGGKSDGKQA